MQCSQATESEATALLILRSKGHQRCGDLVMMHDNISKALREYEAVQAIGEALRFSRNIVARVFYTTRVRKRMVSWS